MQNLRGIDLLFQNGHPNLRRLLSNASIQPHFDYACLAWYPNLSKELKNRI